MKRTKLIIALLVACQCVAWCSETTLAELWEECCGKHAEISAGDVQEFYQENAPDLLQEIRTRIAQIPEKATGFLQPLVDGYEQLQSLRKENSEGFQWQIQRFGAEVKMICLGHEIKQLEQLLKNDSEADNSEKRSELDQKKSTLRQQLEEAFDASQQHRQIEINRLEAEMKMLGQLIEERKENKELILQEQFKKLTE